MSEIELKDVIEQYKIKQKKLEQGRKDNNERVQREYRLKTLDQIMNEAIRKAKDDDSSK